jgi:hypothetical protein
MNKLALLAGVAVLVVLPAFASSQTAPPPATEPAATQPLTRTVGVNIINRTANPDGSLSLLFQWPDKDKHLVTRSVILNSATVVGIDGQLKTLADVTDAVCKKKAVATCGPDMVTAVSIRFGRAMIVMNEDQLTPLQVASLRAAAPPDSPASDATLEKRVDKLVASLQLNDPAKEQRLHAIISTDLRAVRDAHNAGFAPKKSVHADFIAGLESELSGKQIETLKDQLTGRRVPVTFQVYQEIVPNLSADEKAKMLDMLKQARETCLDVKDSEEMSRVFEPVKKQIQAYLIANGHDWKTLYKNFVDSQKPATQP